MVTTCKFLEAYSRCTISCHKHVTGDALARFVICSFPVQTWCALHRHVLQIRVHKEQNCRHVDSVSSLWLELCLKNSEEILPLLHLQLLKGRVVTGCSDGNRVQCVCVLVFLEPTETHQEFLWSPSIIISGSREWLKSIIGQQLWETDRFRTCWNTKRSESFC